MFHKFIVPLYRQIDVKYNNKLYQMKKVEIKITSFQAENYRLQLLYITKEMKNGTIKKEYEVRENRKIIYNSVLYDNAKEVYARCINDNL